MLGWDCMPDVDYSWVDLGEGEETLLHQKIDPNYPANWIVCSQAVVLVAAGL
jgi:hypothetical protein